MLFIVVVMFTDLVAFRTVLVEQSQPLSPSLQNQKHHSYQNMVYALQEHDYEACGEGNSQMAVTLVKEEVGKHIFPLFSKIESCDRPA